MEKVKIIDFPFKHQRYLKANRKFALSLLQEIKMNKAKTGN